jgi:hypothetical protein
MAPRTFHPRRPRKILYLIAGFAALYWFGVRHGLGTEAERQQRYQAPAAKRSKLEWTSDGYVKPDGYGEHPIGLFDRERT